MFKKRGFFPGRKAQATHEQMFIIFEVIVFVFFVYILVSFVKDVEESTIFEKNYLARDLAMIVNTVYASPQDLAYIYLENTSMFDVVIKNNKVRVKDPLQIEEVDKIYWFADENTSRLDIDEPFNNVDNLGFVKIQMEDRTLVNVIPTTLEVIEYCSEYDDELECAMGRDMYGNRCVPTYSTTDRYIGCELCVADWCYLASYYEKDWLVAIDPCDCVD